MSALTTGGARNSREIDSALLDLANRKGGRLRAEDVLEEARDENSPLHKRFDWDDTKAAEQWRYWQARTIIAVAVNVIPMKNANRTTRAFVSLSIDRSNKGGYRVMADVLTNDTLRQQLIDDSIEQMGRFRQRFASIEELGSVFDEMQRTEQKLKPKKKSDEPVTVHVKM